jgi:hypothetical protein
MHARPFLEFVRDLYPQLSRAASRLVEEIRCYVGVQGGPLRTFGIHKLGPKRATLSVLKPCRRVSGLLGKLDKRSETDASAADVPDLVQAIRAIRPWFYMILNHFAWSEPLPTTGTVELFPEYGVEPIASTPLDRLLWIIGNIEKTLNRWTPRIDKLLAAAKRVARTSRREPTGDANLRRPPREHISDWMPLKTAARRLGIGSSKKAVEKLSASLQDKTTDFWFQRLNRQTYRFDTREFV